MGPDFLSFVFLKMFFFLAGYPTIWQAGYRIFKRPDIRCNPTKVKLNTVSNTFFAFQKAKVGGKRGRKRKQPHAAAELQSPDAPGNTPILKFIHFLKSLNGTLIESSYCFCYSLFLSFFLSLIRIGLGVTFKIFFTARLGLPVRISHIFFFFLIPFFVSLCVSLRVSLSLSSFRLSLLLNRYMNNLLAMLFHEHLGQGLQYTRDRLIPYKNSEIFKKLQLQYKIENKMAKRKNPQNSQI